MKRCQTVSAVFLGLWLGVGTPAPAQTPVGASPTFQGQLQENGQPANGDYDFRFQLFDAADAGTAVSQVLPVSDVTVEAGVFSVELDFVAMPEQVLFEGDGRWIEVSVTNAGGRVFTTLTPRQKLTAAPYAAYALNSPDSAWVANGEHVHNRNDGNVGIGTESPAFKLHVAGDVSADGFVQSVSPDLQSGVYLGWGLDSDGIEVARVRIGGNGIGATNGIDIQRVGNRSLMRIRDDGKVGIGTAKPRSRLEVFSDDGTPTAVRVENTSGSYGVHAIGSSNGVRGEAATGFGVAGVGRIGVHGTSSDPTGPGVAGRHDADGFAVFGFGKLGASGTKSFRIDHPDDPENKYLLHYAAESPEVINFYRGTVTLDGSGEAVVELPGYFAKINRAPSYQLTPLGAAMPNLHIAERIDESALQAGAAAAPETPAPLCRFRVGGGVPGGEVCWRVEAVRNDRWVATYGAPVEQDKRERERSSYQHPELYGGPTKQGPRQEPVPAWQD